MALMNHANEALLERLLDVGAELAAEVRELAEDLEDGHWVVEPSPASRGAGTQPTEAATSAEARSLLSMVDRFEAARMELEGQQAVMLEVSDAR